MNEHYPFTLPPLPHGDSAFAPYLASVVLRAHHERHFGGYIKKLNALLKTEERYHSWSLERLARDCQLLPPEIREEVRQNACGAHDHALYFSSIAPASKSGSPSPRLLDAIERSFGGMEAMRRALTEAALAQFGSGYAWLIASPEGELSVTRSANHDLPQGTALLNADVWEHAYYLQYLDQRSDYLAAWWQLIDWPLVSARYEALFERRPNYPTP